MCRIFDRLSIGHNSRVEWKKSKMKREDSKIFEPLGDFTDIIKYCTSSPMLALPRRLLDAGEGDQYFRSESATVSWRGTLDENGRERR